MADYRYADGDLKLGQLRGNHFEVLLRPPPKGWGTGRPAAAAGVSAASGVSAADAFRRLRDEVRRACGIYIREETSLGFFYLRIYFSYVLFIFQYTPKFKDCSG